MAQTFTQSQLQAIADALGDTGEGLTGSEISHLLASARIRDTDPTLTKRIRIYNAFAHHQNKEQDRLHIIAFIKKAMKPENFTRSPERFEPLRANLNRALAFAGIAVEPTGKLVLIEQATTLGEAAQRARDLRADLLGRGVHPDVLAFCRQELLADNYFHAVLEAVKSVAEKIRKKTGLTEDGGTLVDLAFSGKAPLISINALASESERSEQSGFANLIKGTFGMFRNTTAHAARVNWPMSKSDAEDLLTIVSMIHRRIDGASIQTRP